nr:hypothetical protein [Tanacetum cinerariifolium]
MLELTDKMKPYVTVEIGDGKTTSVLYDSWNGNDSLTKYISKRDVYDARFCYNATVADMIKDGAEAALSGNYLNKGNVVLLAVWFLIDVVHQHILQHGFLSGYKHWTFHGELDTPPPIPISQPASVLETSLVIDDIKGLVRDALGVNSLNLKSEESSESRLEGDIGDIEGDIEEESKEEDIEEESEEDIGERNPGDEDIRYKKLLKECDKELYQGCKFSNLSFTLRLYHIKCVGEISNKTFSMILELIKDAFSHLSSLPSSNYEAKKMTYDLGLGYQKIHKTTKDMRWHDMGLTKDRKLRHPADGLTWKAFDARYPKFASDPRSVRLGLVSDGFNPFCTMSTSYSTWTVVLIPYNLPPWIYMKQ